MPLTPVQTSETETVEISDFEIEIKYKVSVCLDSVTDCPVTVSIDSKFLDIQALDSMFASDSVYNQLIVSNETTDVVTQKIGNLEFEETI